MTDPMRFAWPEDIKVINPALPGYYPDETHISQPAFICFSLCISSSSNLGLSKQWIWQIPVLQDTWADKLLFPVHKMNLGQAWVTKWFLKCSSPDLCLGKPWDVAEVDLFSRERLIFLFYFSAFCEGRPKTHQSSGWPSSSSHSTCCCSLEANRTVSLWELPAELWTPQDLPSLFLPSQECTAAKENTWSSQWPGFGTVLEDCNVERRLSSQLVSDSQMLNKWIWMMFIRPVLGALMRAVHAALSTHHHRGYSDTCHLHPFVPWLPETNAHYALGK